MSISDQKLAELLNDDSFVRWLKGEATEEECRKWNAWEQRDSLHADLKNKARLLYDIPMDSSSGVGVEQQLSRLNKRIDKKIRAADSAKRKRKGYTLLAAAVIVLLLAVVSFMSLSLNENVDRSKNTVYKTVEVGNGETATLNISDGSQIRLNANSSLRYKTGHFDNDTVEVWLKGEGYFSIIHDPEGQKRIFIVHTPDGDIQELGTKFNINTKFDGTDVVLEEGRVKLTLRSQDQKNGMEAVMEPGQKALLHSVNDTITFKEVDPSLYTAWVDGKLKFKESSLKEIIRTVEATYGISVVVSDSSLLNRRVSGSLQNPDLKTLLKGLEQVLNLEFKQQSETRFTVSGQ